MVKMTFDDKIICSGDIDHVPQPGGYGQIIFRSLKEHGDCPTQIQGVTGEKDLRSDYLQRCIRTAIKLRSKGIKEGDIITISCYNHFNSSVPYIGGLFIGAISANIDPSVTLEETIHLLKKVKPKLVFIDSEHEEHFEKAIKCAEVETELVIFGNSKKHEQFSEFLKESKEELNFKPVEIQNLKTTAIILFSSGSTGLPKGICLSYLAMDYLCRPMPQFSKLTLLTFASIYWFTQVMTLLASLRNNFSRVILHKFDETIMWNVIATHKVNYAVMSSRHLISMLKVERPASVNISCLYGLVLAGTKISEELLIEAQANLPTTKVVQAYGLTEAGTSVLEFDPKIPHEGDRLIKSIGHPLAGISYKVVDVDTQEPLGPHQQGELRLKSDFQMLGYYGEDSSDCWDSDGWLKTGDMVYYDEQHYFYYVERIKEMIKYRGSQVYPCIVEDVLLTHPKVLEAVVIGVPHREHGDLPTAIVVLEKCDDSSMLSEEIIKYVGERVDDKSKLRGGVTIVKELPHATSGKPKRRLIKEMFRNGQL